MPDGRSRKFTFVQEANSVVTNPVPKTRFAKKALSRSKVWHGRAGTIKAVDLSFDGGVTGSKLKSRVLLCPRLDSLQLQDRVER